MTKRECLWSDLVGVDSDRHHVGCHLDTLDGGRDHTTGSFARSRDRGSSVALVLEALAAEDRPSLRGFEGNGGLDPAIRADGAGLGARDSGSGRAASGTHRRTGAPGLAGLAPFGVVLKLFVEEKELFAGSEDELSTAICASQ